jgi:hypothetical protein
MGDALVDRRDAIRDLQVRHETKIHEQAHAYSQTLNEISNLLLEFRRQCIANHRSEVIPLYRSLKQDFREFMTERNNRVEQCESEISRLSTELQEISRSVESASNSFSSNAAQVLADLKKRKSAGDPSVNASVREVDAKTEKILSEFGERLRTLKSSHQQRSRTAKAEVSRAIRAAVASRAGEFAPFHDRIQELRMGLSQLRKGLLAALKLHEQACSRAHDQKEELYGAFLEKVVAIQKQKDALYAQGKQSSMARTSELLGVRQTFEDRMTRMQEQFDKHQRKLDSVARSMTELKKSKPGLTGPRKEAELSVRQSLIADLEQEYVKEKEKNDCHTAVFEEIRQVNEEMLASSEKEMERALQRLNSSDLKLKDNVRASIQKIERELACSLKSTKEMARLRCARLREIVVAVKSARASAISEYQRSNQETTAKLDDMTAADAKQLEIELAKTKAEVTALLRQQASMISSTREKQELGLEQARLESMEALQPKERPPVVVAPFMRQVRRPERSEQMNMAIDAEKSRLALLESTIEGMCAQNQQQLSKYDTELSTLEKTRRQLERRIESEIRQIDDEYERMIQVEEVKLSQKIENISRLYDSDENQRGREVVEIIRKLNEIRMRTATALKDKARALEQMRKGPLSPATARARADRCTEMTELMRRREMECAEDLARIEQTKNEALKELRNSIRDVEKSCRDDVNAVRTDCMPVLESNRNRQAEIVFQISEVDAKKRLRLREIETKYAHRTSEVVENHKKRKDEFLKQITSAKEALVLLERNHAAEVHDCEQEVRNVTPDVSSLFRALAFSEAPDTARMKSEPVSRSAVECATDELAKLNAELRRRCSLMIALLSDNQEARVIPDNHSRNALPPISEGRN